jgi:hypothetical protein
LLISARCGEPLTSSVTTRVSSLTM